MNREYSILGVMSGSSLDGLDLALCRISGLKGNYKWEIIESKFVPLSEEWRTRLRKLPNDSAKELAQADFDFGYLIGAACREFIRHKKVDYISSHGHTIFHFPDKGSSCQIGNGGAISARAGVPVINDFRSMDIAFGGEGAPIVSMFDRFAFPGKDMMLNLGGIANITILSFGKETAFDIAPCNQLLNSLSDQKGFEYDKDGLMASKGEIDLRLLDQLDNVEYMKRKAPKSLDNTYVSKVFMEIIDKNSSCVEDKLRTVCEFISNNIFKSVESTLDNNAEKKLKMLVSGGGASNTFLIKVIKKKIPDIDLEVPVSQFIDFKEAVLMAFLGYLRIIGEVNVLSSFTGAAKDSCGGAIYHQI